LWPRLAESQPPLERAIADVAATGGIAGTAGARAEPAA